MVEYTNLDSATSFHSAQNDRREPSCCAKLQLGEIGATVVLWVERSRNCSSLLRPHPIGKLLIAALLLQAWRSHAIDFAHYYLLFTRYLPTVRQWLMGAVGGAQNDRGIKQQEEQHG